MLLGFEWHMLLGFEWHMLLGFERKKPQKVT